jgi:hypothetical protein
MVNDVEFSGGKVISGTSISAPTPNPDNKT